MGGQIITYFIGQCGVQLAHACWELYCLEHCLSPDGKLFATDAPDDFSYYNFFSESSQGQLVPRTVLIDLEPSTLDEIKVGSYRKLFSRDSLVNGLEDAANNFARGYFGCGRTIIDEVIRSSRKVVEGCDNVQAFIIHHSFGGGTGSGFTSIMMEYLGAEFTRKTKVEFGVFPSPTLSVAIVEPYNATLALHTPMENADLVAFFENESLFSICSKKLAQQAPLYTHLNRMTAQVISGMTVSMRFDGPVHSSLIDFQTNLVPYPRIHFPMISFSPFLTASRLEHQSMSTKELTINVGRQDNQMAQVDPADGAYMSCCLLYRGDVNIREVNYAINYQKQNHSSKWVDWCPTGYKIGINYQPMTVIPDSGIAYSPRSLTFLCNSTAIKSVVNRLSKKFGMMFERKSFIHWYIGEGLEEDEFKAANDDVLSLEKDYEILEENAVINSSFGLEKQNRLNTIEKNRKFLKKGVKENQNNEAASNSNTVFDIIDQEVNSIDEKHAKVLTAPHLSTNSHRRKATDVFNTNPRTIADSKATNFQSMIELTYQRLGNSVMEYSSSNHHHHQRDHHRHRPSYTLSNFIGTLPKLSESTKNLTNISNYPENIAHVGKVNMLLNNKSKTTVSAFDNSLNNFGRRKKSGMYKSCANIRLNSTTMFKYVHNYVK